MTRTGSLSLVAVMVASAIVFLPAPASEAAPQKLGRTVLVGGNAARRADYQRWIDAARARVRQVKTQVIFRESNCPGSEDLTACVIQPRSFGSLYRFHIPRALLDPRNYDPVDLQNTVLHELAHVYDFKYNRDRHRGAWLKIFGLPGPFYSQETNPPYERFAVGYSYCAQGFTYERALTRLEYDVYEHKFTREQYDATCAMLRPVSPVIPLKPPKRKP